MLDKTELGSFLMESLLLLSFIIRLKVVGIFLKYRVSHRYKEVRARLEISIFTGQCHIHKLKMLNLNSPYSASETKVDLTASDFHKTPISILHVWNKNSMSLV